MLGKENSCSKTYKNTCNYYKNLQEIKSKDKEREKLVAKMNIRI